MTVPELQTYDQKLATQADRTMREIIVLLVRAQQTRLTPETIEGVRRIVIAGFFEVARLSAANTNASQQRLRAAGPWDDEPTDPQRPSNRPRKP